MQTESHTLQQYNNNSNCFTAFFPEQPRRTGSIIRPFLDFFMDFSVQQ